MSSIPFVPGQRFGRLVTLSVTHIEEYGHPRLVWICSCDCGNRKTARPSALRRGLITSCGCFHKEQLSARTTTHGHSGTPEHKIWKSMRRRCNGQNTQSYERYGGRGIEVCERWQSFENFLADMGPRPSPEHSIERKDNDGPYAPWNCRWATKNEQARNTSRNHRITFDGKTQILSEWSRELSLSVPTLIRRLQSGCSIGEAFSVPAGALPRKKTERIPPPPPATCGNHHPLPENLSFDKAGYWKCRACSREATRRYRARKKAGRS